MNKEIIYVSPAAAKILRARGITLDSAALAARPVPGEKNLLSAAEKLEIFFKAHGRIHLEPDAELAGLRMMNRANREFYGE